MSINQTPNAQRLHIGIFGHVNAGKTSLLNALTMQEVGVVSSVAGTTTDPIYKAMELHGIGPVVFIDTAGFGDTSTLGFKRLLKTSEAMDKCDVAIVVATHESSCLALLEELKNKHIPFVVVYNKFDPNKDQKDVEKLQKTLMNPIIKIQEIKEVNVDQIRQQLIRILPEDYGNISICGSLVSTEDIVLLVMPQDIQAPKGRLILPQVQTIRDLLDHHCIVVSVTSSQFESSLKVLSKSPKLIVCDSQVFKQVYDKKPMDSLLTSFSVLFAKYKGDIKTFVEGASHIESLTSDSKVLIAEACTHAPLEEDIGRVKIPAMLKKRYGQNMQIDIVSGATLPDNLESYDLIVHCGACMFNRKFVLERLKKIKAMNIPITNYGVCIAYLSGILDKVVY